MTLPRLDAMNAYWERNPPLHQLVAAYMGFKSEEKPKDVSELVAAMGGGNG